MEPTISACLPACTSPKRPIYRDYHKGETQPQNTGPLRNVALLLQASAFGYDQYAVILLKNYFMVFSFHHSVLLPSI